MGPGLLKELIETSYEIQVRIYRSRTLPFRIVDTILDDVSYYPIPSGQGRTLVQLQLSPLPSHTSKLNYCLML